ncbi:MAG: thioredoxin family protein [Chlorobi bacterium]|nr:thioredoxin family protein [Chlorobiota bacterium]
MQYHFAESLEDALRFLKEHEAVMVFFSDESCNVGDALSPKLQNMLKEHFDKMDFLEINVQMIPEARGHFNIFVIPSVLVYFDGRESIRQARHVNPTGLAREIDRLYALFF